MIFFISHFGQLSFLTIKEELTCPKRINGQDTACRELMQSGFEDDERHLLAHTVLQLLVVKQDNRHWHLFFSNPLVFLVFQVYF